MKDRVDGRRGWTVEREGGQTERFVLEMICLPGTVAANKLIVLEFLEL